MNHGMLNELDEEEKHLSAIAVVFVISGKINAKRECLGEFHHLFLQKLSEGLFLHYQETFIVVYHFVTIQKHLLNTRKH